MKRQNCGPCLGKLVHRFPRVITLAYDLRLTIIIPCFEDLKGKVEKLGKSIWDIFNLSIFPKNAV